MGKNSVLNNLTSEDKECSSAWILTVTESISAIVLSYLLEVKRCLLTTPTLFVVITGKVTSLAPGPRGTLLIGVSLIRTYKAGRLSITQVGEAMSIRLVSQCRKCPLLRRGTRRHIPYIRYIFCALPPHS